METSINDSDSLINKQKTHMAAEWKKLPVEKFKFSTHLHHWINFYPLYCLKKFFIRQKKDSFLTICDGRGLEAQWLINCGVTDVLSTDLVPVHLQALVDKGILTKCKQANAEKLPFENNQFDWGGWSMPDCTTYRGRCKESMNFLGYVEKGL